MSTLFDLRLHSSIDLDRLEIAINSGICEARKLKLMELEETLISYRLIVMLAKKTAVERESETWAANVSKQILNNEAL